MQAVIGNRQYEEYGVASIPFPIPEERYDEITWMLEQIEVGDVLKADCYITELKDCIPVLKRLEGTEVNLDELDYLAQRLDSFAAVEVNQFQAMAAKNGYTTLHHYIPRGQGGQDAEHNLITLCSDCHALAHRFNSHDYPDMRQEDIVQLIVEYLADEYAPDWNPWRRE